MEKLIITEHLYKKFGATVAVDDVNLSIPYGEIYGLVGSDGAGKTTTLRLLVGALKPDSGKTVICGFHVEKQGEQARARVGYLSQRFSLYEDLSVLENIRFFAEVRGLSREEWLPRCMELLDFVGLANFKNRHAGQLSGGMKQKLGLASALVARPSVLLLDEPTTGVDPVTRQDFWQLLIRIVSQDQVAVILTTPYMDEAARCHRVGFMRHGQIIAENSPSQLRKNLDGRIVEVRGGPLSSLRLEVERLNGVEDIRAFGDKLHLRVMIGFADDVISSLTTLSHVHRDIPLGARLVSPTLEDVFISLAEVEAEP